MLSSSKIPWGRVLAWAAGSEDDDLVLEEEFCPGVMQSEV